MPEERSDPADRGSIDRRVRAIGAAQLAGPVRNALGDSAARVTAWRHAAVDYDFLNPSSGGVYRFTGTAETGAGEEAPWSLILKVTRSPDAGDPLPDELAATRREAVRWDRELLAYESGFLEALGGSFVATACHGGARDGDTGWLWLEDLGGISDGTWPLERWALVGRALGRFNGGFLAAGVVPDAPWLGRRWLRVWTTVLTPHHYGRSIPPAPVWDEALVRAAYPAALRERLEALWADRGELVAAVEALPATCSHLDAHRRNLFIREGTEQVVAIDWGLLGLAAPGEEIASTLVGTVASGEEQAEDAAELAATLYASYVTGLREAGWDGDEREVRLAFAAAAGLRALSVLGLHVLDDAAGAREDTAAALARSAAFVTVLAGLGDEARARVR